MIPGGQQLDLTLVLFGTVLAFNDGLIVDQNTFVAGASVKESVSFVVIVLLLLFSQSLNCLALVII